MSMKIPKLLYIVLALAFYKWAMREIKPLHPDVPKIVRRKRELEEEYKKLCP